MADFLRLFDVNAGGLGLKKGQGILHLSFSLTCLAYRPFFRFGLHGWVPSRGLRERDESPSTSYPMLNIFSELAHPWRLFVWLHASRMCLLQCSWKVGNLLRDGGCECSGSSIWSSSRSSGGSRWRRGKRCVWLLPRHWRHQPVEASTAGRLFAVSVQPQLHKGKPWQVRGLVSQNAAFLKRFSSVFVLNCGVVECAFWGGALKEEVAT